MEKKLYGKSYRVKIRENLMCFPPLECTGFTAHLSLLSGTRSPGNEVEPSRLVIILTLA